MDKKKLVCFKFSSSSNQKGFSLLEILIALVMSSFILGVVINKAFESDPRAKLDQTITLFERAIRFASDEATLRNSVVRVRIILDKTPQEFVVEYGPDDNFTLPKAIKTFGDAKDENEKDKEKELRKKINKDFARVKEFQEENQEIDESVRVIGVGSRLFGDKLILDPEASVYVFPTGQKDDAIIIMGTEDEMSGFVIEAFTMDYTSFYEPFDDITGDNLADVQIEKAKQIFEKWMTK